MSDKIPDHIDPLVFADRRSVFAGTQKIEAFERLSDSLSDRSGELDIRIEFGKIGKQAIITGQVSGTLSLECQSCLQALQWPLAIEFKLVVVTTLQEADKFSDYEPLMFDGDKISLKALIEDEILLTLPDYPKHQHECIEHNSSADADYTTTDNQTKAENPFSVLAKLKKTGD